MKQILRVWTYSKDKLTDIVEYKDIRDGDLLNRRMFLKVVEDYLTRRLKLKNGLVLTTDFNKEGELVVEVGLLYSKGGVGSVDIPLLKKLINEYLDSGIKKEWEKKSKELNELADRLGRINIPKYPMEEDYHLDKFSPPSGDVEFRFEKGTFTPISFSLSYGNIGRIYTCSPSETGK